MPANFVLTLTAPREYGLEKFDTDASVWSATDSNKTSVSRYTGDPIRSSVMKIEGICWTLGDGRNLGDGLYLGDSIAGMGEGAYKDFEVTPGIRYAFSCLTKVDKGLLDVSIHDQSNDMAISSFENDGNTWKSHESSVVIPDGCVTLRVVFSQNEFDRGPGPFYVDDVSLSGNALLYDPDSYSRIAERLGTLHETLRGRRIYDLRAIHYSLHLRWNFLGEEQFEALRELYYSNELLYFDDGNVPPLSEREYVYETTQYDYFGIASPSDTHKAYTANSSLLPLEKWDFEAAEFTTMDYVAIGTDDGNYMETSNPEENEYLYHKFLILSTINQEDVRRFRVKVCMSGNDYSPQDIDGGILYAWNGSNWVELTTCTNDGKADLTYSTAEIEVARQFIDPQDNYIRLLLRSRNHRNGTNNICLRSYYAECEINENLNLTIQLSHKAILDENGDVISVKNITQGKTLTLGDEYSISNDRRSITVIGQTSGDQIEIKYRRYFEVMFSNIPEEWLNGNPTGTDKIRNLEITLLTLSESK